MPLKDLNRKAPRKSNPKKSAKVESSRSSKSVDRKTSNKRVDKSKSKLVKPTKRVVIGGAGIAALALIGAGTYAMNQGSEHTTTKSSKNQDSGISESRSISKITKSDGKPKKVKKDNNKLASVLKGESTSEDLKNLLDPAEQKKIIGSNSDGKGSSKTLADVVKDVLGNGNNSDVKPEKTEEQLTSKAMPGDADALAKSNGVQNVNSTSSKGDQVTISKPIPGRDENTISDGSGEILEEGHSGGTLTGGHGIGGATGENSDKDNSSTTTGNDKSNGSQTSEATTADSIAKSQADSIAQSLADSQSVANSIATSNATSIAESQQKSTEIDKSEAAMSEWADSYVNSIAGVNKTPNQTNGSQENIDIAKSITDSVNASYDAAHNIKQSVDMTQTQQYATTPTAESSVNSLESQAV